MNAGLTMAGELQLVTSAGISGIAGDTDVRTGDAPTGIAPIGAHTVKQIVPDGEKLARIPGVGETGIDDLYRVSRADVDYVVVEYKFVGGGTGKGSTRLGDTADGKQGSEGWILGSGRLEKAVENRAIAADIADAAKAGRTETWVVTTRPDGSTIVEVLDSFGKPKPTDTSKILISGTNLLGTQP